MKAEVRLIQALAGHQGAIYSLEQGPEPGMVFSAGADKLLTAWDVSKGTGLPFQALLPAPVYSLCHIPQHRLLLAGTSTGAIHIIDLEKKQETAILQNHRSQVFDIRYSEKLDVFYTLGGDGLLTLCSLSKRSVLRVLTLSHAKLRQMDLNADETELAVATGEGDIVVLDAETLRIHTRFRAHEQSANSLRYHPDGQTLITGGKDAYLKTWDIKNNFMLLQSVPAHNFAIYRICFSPDNTLFATASRDKTIKLWNADTGDFLLRLNRESHQGHVNSVNTLLWNRNNNCLVSAGDDRGILCWEVGTSVV